MKKKLISLMMITLISYLCAVPAFASTYYTQADVDREVNTINQQYQTEFEVTITGTVNESEYLEIIKNVETMAKEQAEIERIIDSLEFYSVGTILPTSASRANPELNTIFKDSQIISQKVESGGKTGTAYFKQSVYAIRDEDKKFIQVKDISTSGSGSYTSFIPSGSGKYAQLDGGLTLMTYQVGRLDFRNGEIEYGNNSWKVTAYWP